MMAHHDGNTNLSTGLPLCAEASLEKVAKKHGVQLGDEDDEEEDRAWKW